MEEPHKFDLFEFHHMFEDDILLLYKGPFNKHILGVFSKYIQGIINRYPKISKKVFGIFIELAQNIAKFSADKVIIEDRDHVGAGTLVIGELDNCYTFFTGNSVPNKDLDQLIQKCELINSLNRDDLRKYKREQFGMPHEKDDLRYIGLIQVALTSGNQLELEVTPENDELSFFSITVTVEKT